MTTETLLAEQQLIRQATDTLVDKLGLMEATRFFEPQAPRPSEIRGTASVMAKRAG